MESNKDFIKITTKDKTPTYIRKSQVTAVEIVPATSRAEGFLKVYVPGYHFSLNMDLEEFENLMKDSP